MIKYIPLTTSFISYILQLGIAASYAVWAVSRSFAIFVVARIIGGISKGNVSLSTAIVADICPPEKRGRGMVRFCFYKLSFSLSLSDAQINFFLD